MGKLKVILLLSALSGFTTACAEGVRGNCTVATLQFRGYVCDYIIPSILGLFLLSLVAILILACKLFQKCRAQTEKGNQEMVISSVMKYNSSPNIHSIVDGPSPPKYATAIEIIKPTLHQQLPVDRAIASSTSFLGKVSCEEKEAPLPSESAKEPKALNHHRRSGLPRSVYMSLKRFMPSSRSSIKSLGCGRPNNLEIVYEPYGDTVERIAQDGYVDMTQNNSGVVATNMNKNVLPTRTGGEKPNDVPYAESNLCQSSCRDDTSAEEKKKQLIRDYVNVSPSDSNDSAANCSYAFPQLRSFPEKLRALKIGKLSLSPTSHSVLDQTET